jgi:hypothetical protein
MTTRGGAAERSGNSTWGLWSDADQTSHFFLRERENEHHQFHGRRTCPCSDLCGGNSEN